MLVRVGNVIHWWLTVEFSRLKMSLATKENKFEPRDKTIPNSPATKQFLTKRENNFPLSGYVK